MLTGEMLARSAHRFPTRPAVSQGLQIISYQELDGRADQMARKLVALGLPAGTTVGIISRNLPEYGISFFGVARSGYILTNVSVLYAPDEMLYVLRKARIEVLIFDQQFTDTVMAVLPDLPGIRTVIEIGAAAPAAGHLRFNDFCAPCAADEPALPPLPLLQEDAPFCMTYTGGTTGRPKGVLCSHRARAITAHTVMVEEAIDERDVVGIVTPMFHVAALNIMFQPAILAGASTVLLAKWSPQGFIEMVEQSGMTACFMVPTQAASLLQAPEFDPDKLRNWTKVSFAGAPLPDWVQHELRARLPWLHITQIYGQSEMGVIAVLRHWYLPAKLGSVGRQPYNVDVRVVNQDGTDVAPGEIGEVVSRGANLMLGYFDEPAQTREFFRLGDDWGWSGDLASVDADGFITLIDRSKDMIISGGENIYPKEIENVIFELPEVADCAVFGIPQPPWGEVPAAWISLQPGQQLSAEQVLAHCEAKLARFKRPRLVEFVTEFPKTAIGKIQKNLIREQYWRDQDKKI